jgi:hypothetical protein
MFGLDAYGSGLGPVANTLTILEPNGNCVYQPL